MAFRNDSTLFPLGSPRAPAGGLHQHLRFAVLGVQHPAALSLLLRPGLLLRPRSRVLVYSLDSLGSTRLKP